MAAIFTLQAFLFDKICPTPAMKAARTQMNHQVRIKDAAVPLARLIAFLALGLAMSCGRGSEQGPESVVPGPTSSGATGTGSVPAFYGISGDGGVILPKIKHLESGSADAVYRENGNRFEIYSEPEKGWHLPLEVVEPEPGKASLAFVGCRGMVLEGACGDPSGRRYPNTKDRVELAVINHSSGARAHQLKFEKVRYFSFRIMFGPSTEPPVAWTLVSQVWQQAPGHSPPFAIWMGTSGKSQGPIRLLFVARDDTTSRDVTSVCPPARRDASTCPHVLHSTTVTPGQWTRFTVRLKPSHAGTGDIAIWQDDILRPTVVWRHDWGYTPGDAVDAPSNAFDVRIGIYRRAQPRQLSVYFDDVRYGPTWESVNG